MTPFNLAFFEYLPLLFALFFVIALSCVLVILSFVFSPSENDPEKVSAYECGFNPFEDARETFDIKFYVIAVLFILFDIEVALLLPFVSVLFSLGGLQASYPAFFFLILIIGFIYEWRKDALNWS